MISTEQKKLVEIGPFPPPYGAWDQRIRYVADHWRSLGHDCILMNIGPSRKLNNPDYLNIKGPFNYLYHIARLARGGHVMHTHTNAKGIKGKLAVCGKTPFLAGPCVHLV